MDVSTALASNPSASTSQDVATDTHDVAVVTDPDCLGPCEPGTQVTLGGIVWHESENGRGSLMFTKDYFITIHNISRHTKHDIINIQTFCSDL